MTGIALGDPERRRPGRTAGNLKAASTDHGSQNDADARRSRTPPSA
ncbi:hypothetical protein L083_1126 [Actinoplanes sp. N902-109]|nr:hypothetical protein L083_1126 [Actinoplanes sp. N902-109]